MAEGPWAKGTKLTSGVMRHIDASVLKHMEGLITPAILFRGQKRQSWETGFWVKGSWSTGYHEKIAMKSLKCIVLYSHVWDSRLWNCEHQCWRDEESTHNVMGWICPRKGGDPRGRPDRTQPQKGLDLVWAGLELAGGSDLPVSGVLPALSFLSPSKEDQHRVHSIFISVVSFHSIS